MAHIEIRDRWTGKPILCGAFESLKDCLEKNHDKNLSRADLVGADLAGADLTGANLRDANLTGAKTKYTTWPAPPMVLLADWGDVSDELCRELMRYDAHNHPDPQRFIEWREAGQCPYTDLALERAASFTAQLALIQDDFLSRPVKSAYELMQELLKEKCSE